MNAQQADALAKATGSSRLRMKTLYLALIEVIA